MKLGVKDMYNQRRKGKKTLGVKAIRKKVENKRESMKRLWVNHRVAR